MRKITMFEKQVRGHSKSMYTARRKGWGWSTLKTYDNMQGEVGGFRQSVHTLYKNFL